MNLYKYPRTPHLPFSESKTDDDKTLVSDKHFYNFNEVIVTVKMDGENTTVYPNGTFHARSLSSRHEEYQSWLLRNIQNWAYNIPKDHRICGEYLYARHSIAYDDLIDYFLAFSVWNNGYCLSWDDSIDIFKDLNIHSVPVLYRGKYDTSIIKNLASMVISQGQEGIVVRNADGYNYSDFSTNIAKYVRPNHVQTDEHWKSKEIVKNSVKIV